MPRCRKCQPVPEEVRRAADLLERRWLISIVFAALSGALRFNEFVEAVDGISPRMLSERLRDLEQAGLIERTRDPNDPADGRVPSDASRPGPCSIDGSAAPIRGRPTLKGSVMTKVLYTAEAHVTGGRAEGHGLTPDGQLDVQLRTPTEMGGEGDGTNPEQLFAVGWAACFEGALGAVGRREKVDVEDAAIDSKISLITTEERGFNIAARLDVTLPSISDGAQAVGDREGRPPGLPLLERDARQRRGGAHGQRPAGGVAAASGPPGSGRSGSTRPPCSNRAQARALLGAQRRDGE